jgi:hypothetical protein
MVTPASNKVAADKIKEREEFLTARKTSLTFNILILFDLRDTDTPAEAYWSRQDAGKRHPVEIEVSIPICV